MRVKMSINVKGSRDRLASAAFPADITWMSMDARRDVTDLKFGEPFYIEVVFEDGSSYHWRAPWSPTDTAPNRLLPFIRWAIRIWWRDRKNEKLRWQAKSPSA